MNFQRTTKSKFQEHIYQLGRVKFSLSGASQQFEREMLCLLPPAVQWSEDEIHRLNANDDLRQLLNQVLRLHEHIIWIDAACLVSPSGKNLLISGLSSCGKTTTAMALVLRFGWVALAEDLVLIDPQQNEIINFSSPFSLKKGTADLLEKTIDVSPPKIFQNEWVPNQSTNSHLRANFDFAIHLVTGEQTSIRRLSDGEFVRKLLRCSNLSHNRESPDQFVRYLSGAVCYELSAVELLERLDFITSIAK